jgi:peptidoglycan hydrolase-like protein with peptidoglycan-binding domain
MLLAAVAALMVGLGGNAQAGYSEGQAAFERQDYSTALYELEPAAAQGDGRAQYLLGIMYRDGRGVPPDYVTAYAWLHVAAARGQPQAASARDGMSWRLTPSEIDEAQRLAREWRPGNAIATARTPQRNYNADGTYDPNGNAAADNGYRTDSRALNRTETMDLQWNLAVHGYDPGPADGVAGPRTRAAIEQYQMDAQLPVDGRASAALLDHLQYTDPPVRNTRVAGNAPQYPSGGNGTPQYEELPPIEDGDSDTAGMYGPPGEDGYEPQANQPYGPPGSEAYGPSGSESYPGATPAITPQTVTLHAVYVETIERELQARGYHVGPVDGYLDRETQRAIERYQRDSGLAPTGEISLELVNHLRLITGYGTPAT